MVTSHLNVKGPAAKLPSKVAREYRLAAFRRVDRTLELCVLANPEPEHVSLDLRRVLGLVEHRRSHFFDGARIVSPEAGNHAQVRDAQVAKALDDVRRRPLELIAEAGLPRRLRRHLVEPVVVLVVDLPDDEVHVAGPLQEEAHVKALAQLLRVVQEVHLRRQQLDVEP